MSFISSILLQQFSTFNIDWIESNETDAKIYGGSMNISLLGRLYIWHWILASSHWLVQLMQKHKMLSAVISHIKIWNIFQQFARANPNQNSHYHCIDKSWIPHSALLRLPIAEKDLRASFAHSHTQNVNIAKRICCTNIHRKMFHSFLCAGKMSFSFMEFSLIAHRTHTESTPQ